MPSKNYRGLSVKFSIRCPSPSVTTFDDLLAKLEQLSELLGLPVASGRARAGNGLFALKPEIDAELRKSLPQQRSRPRTIFPPSLAEAIRRIHNGKIGHRTLLKFPNRHSAPHVDRPKQILGL